MCTPRKQTGLSYVHFYFLHIIVLDVNLLKRVLTSFFFFFVNRFAYVALVNQKYFFKCFRRAGVF
jgi:hypothetical protein